jgi:DNA polymerase III subunit alpha
MRAMVKTRDAGGAFKDLFDFSERVETRLVNRKSLESLTAAGAFDNLNRNRAQVMNAVDLLLKHSQQSGDERTSGQSNMFGAAEATSRPPLPAAKAWDDLTRLQHEFQALGFYLSAHPLDNYRAVLDRMGVTPASGTGARMRAAGPSRFKLAGVILGKQERTAKSGNKFAFVQLSDGGGAFELTVFSELLAAKRDLLEAGQAILIEADAQGDTRNGSDGSEIRFIARSIDPLAQAAERAAQGIRIRVFDAPDIPAIQKILQAAAGKGRGRVMLSLALDDGEEAEMELPGVWQLTEAVKSSLRQVGGGLEVAEY